MTDAPIVLCVWAPVAAVDAPPVEVLASGGVRGFLLRYYVCARTPRGPVISPVGESWVVNLDALLATWADLPGVTLVAWRAHAWLDALAGALTPDTPLELVAQWRHALEQIRARSFDPLFYWEMRLGVPEICTLRDLFRAHNVEPFEPVQYTDPRHAGLSGDMVTAWAMTRSWLQGLAHVVALNALSRAGRVPCMGIATDALGLGLGNPARENPSSPDAPTGAGGIAPFALPCEDWFEVLSVGGVA